MTKPYFIAPLFDAKGQLMSEGLFLVFKSSKKNQQKIPNFCPFLIKTIKTLYLNGGSASIVPLGDPCYTPNPSIVRIEQGVYSGLGSVSLPNFSMGYYLHYETCCRNGLIDNLANPTSDGISILAIIPDPSIGQNSTPDFGDYPNDAYFCVVNISPKMMVPLKVLYTTKVIPV